MAGYLVQAGVFAAAGTALAGYALHSDIKSGSKRKFSNPTPPTTPVSKKLKLSPLRPFMPARRFRRRPRRRRRFKRSVFRRGRKTFAKRVKRVILKTLEPRVVRQIFNTTFKEGDAATRLTYICSPLNVLIDSVGDTGITGNKVFIKGMSLRGQAVLNVTTPTVTGCIIRISAISTKEQGAGFSGGFIPFGSTTTSLVNPAQTAPDVNPRLFDDTGATFTGRGMTTPFDTSNVKVHRSWYIYMNPSGNEVALQTAPPQIFKIWWPIHKMMQAEDAGQGILVGANRRWKLKGYYFVLQVIATQGGLSNDDVVDVQYTTATHFRDV